MMGLITNLELNLSKTYHKPKPAHTLALLQP